MPCRARPDSCVQSDRRQFRRTAFLSRPVRRCANNNLQLHGRLRKAVLRRRSCEPCPRRIVPERHAHSHKKRRDEMPRRPLIATHFLGRPKHPHPEVAAISQTDWPCDLNGQCQTEKAARPLVAVAWLARSCSAKLPRHQTGRAARAPLDFRHDDVLRLVTALAEPTPGLAPQRFAEVALFARLPIWAGPI
jgi:hypothetical protein